jgi:uncharacterized protein YukE
MADASKEAKLILSAQDKTGDAFKSVGKNIQTLNTSAGSLASGLGKLGIAAVALYAGKKIVDFFIEGGKEAAEDANATRILRAQVDNLGLSYDKVGGTIDDYIQKMFNLGQADTDTTKGLTQLLRVTKDVDGAMTLSTLASDLAASGIKTYEENIDMLQRILLGKGARSLTEYGIQMSDNTTIAQQLAAVQGLVSRTAEQMANDTDGQIKKMGTSWGEFKENLGKFTLYLTDQFARAFNKVFGDTAKTGNTWAFQLALGIERIKFSAENLWLKLKSVFSDEAAQKFNDKWVEVGTEFEKNWKNMIAETGDGSTKSDLEKGLLSIGNQFDATSDDAKKAADKIKDSFKDLSKSIVSAFQDQAKAISDLKNEMSDLNDELAKDLADSDEKYQNDVKKMAKAAQEKIDDIDKQIKEERATMNAGWRTRIEELQAQKLKEQAIIDKAGGVVKNIQAENAKDEFTILQESHTKEIEEIKAQAENKRLELQKEMLERQKFLLEGQVRVAQPGFYESATGEAGTFLGGIGAGAVQNSFNFNFNEVVAGDDGIKQIITQTINELNRQATLRQ